MLLYSYSGKMFLCGMRAERRNTFGTCSFGLCLSSLQRGRARGRKIGFHTRAKSDPRQKKNLQKWGTIYSNLFITVIRHHFSFSIHQICGCKVSVQ